MKINTRIIVALSVVISIIFYFFTDTILNNISPSYQSAVEESANDTAHILAAFLETQIKQNQIQTDLLERTFKKAMQRVFHAKIYDLVKNKINVTVYVVNQNGVVIYDSDNNRYLGKNFSNYNDVFLTLRGKYGARSSFLIPKVEDTKSLIVSAPVYMSGKIIGAVSIVKRKTNIRLFTKLTKNKLIFASLLSLILVLVLSAFILFIVSKPIARLKAYVKGISEDGTADFPKLGKTEIRDLAYAFEELRVKLEGKKYIEHYIQTLTHELKSPLSSIIGASELLNENMDADVRINFVNNIQNEAKRIENIINKMLSLSAVESQKSLNNVEEINVKNLIEDVIHSLLPQLEKKSVTIEYNVKNDIVLTGERFLIRQALANLIQNAINFSPHSASIKISAQQYSGFISLAVSDHGEGIPDYALDKIFDRFYSLPQSENSIKGTGLGLPFVKQVAQLHKGYIEIKNNSGKGVTAELRIPDHL